MSVSDNTTPKRVIQSYLRSEVLCFIQNKSKVLPFDHLVDICVKFFKWDEIAQAKNILSENWNNRLAKHRGPEEERVKKTLIDMTRVLLDPEANLPIFYAVNLNRIPPVGVEHIDVCALATEVSALRAEVRSFTQLRSDIRDIRSALPLATQQEVRGRISCTQDTTTDATRAASQEVLPDEATIAQPTAASLSYARVVCESTSPTVPNRLNYPLKNTKALPVIGKGQGRKLKSVPQKKHIELFVTRLDPATRASEVQESITDIMKADDGLSVDVSDVTCLSLETKHTSYASFHLSITLNASSYQRAFGILMSADVWPDGALVRRFFHRKA